MYNKFKITKIEICRNSTTTTATAKTTTTAENVREEDNESSQIKYQHQGHTKCRAKILTQPKSETSDSNADDEQSKIDEKSYIIIVTVCTSCVAFVFIVGIYISQKK